MSFMYRLVKADISLAPKMPETGRCLLCVPAGWDAYISGEFFEIHEELRRKGWTKLIIDEVADDEMIAAIRNADVVLLWEAYEFLERNASVLCADGRHEEMKPKRMFFCDDVHYFTSHRREQRRRAFEWASVILATYPDKLHQWYPEIAAEKSVWMPHSAASYFSGRESPALISDRVLLSGSRTWPYPFRQFCAAKLDVSVCDVLEHPGYPGYPGDRANKGAADTSALLRVGRERYAELLRTYPAMLVCGSILGYLVAKVFEGMAAGCLTICERASLGGQLSALDFREGEHYIGTDLPTVIEDVNKVRATYLGDVAHWRNITQAAAIKIATDHTTTVRAAQIHSICIRSLEI